MKSKVLIVLAAALVLTAGFPGSVAGSPGTFIVMFNANNPTTGTAPPSQNAASGASITLPWQGSLLRDGYVFGGWNTNAEGTGTNHAGGASITVTGNTVLFARWIPEAADDGVEMVRVEGGTFVFGQNLGTGGGENVDPVSFVTLSSFYIGRTPITRAQFTAVMEGNTNRIPLSHPNWSTVGFNAEENAAAGGANMNQRPITHVSWYYAIVFANRLSIQQRLTPAYELPNQWPNPTSWSTNPDTWGNLPGSSDARSIIDRWSNVRIVPNSTGYRLPTEAQWEFAAKGGNNPDNTTWSGSNNLNEVAWTSMNSGNSPRMVGLLIPNGLGLYDMSGNVWEWVWDVAGGRPGTGEAVTDPEGMPRGGGETWPVRRGGSFNLFSTDARVVYWERGSPFFRNNHVGFRVARPAP
ncbi:MAG: SUMF1/EgtB/PvdO family nonheme iron enzyme [Defluviitaleaceae bacterium]|nr:SUMF1/EgtB/PvdO family nonheme iron enzyme [Defluviitaleaceae bacterium]